MHVRPFFLSYCARPPVYIRRKDMRLTLDEQETIIRWENRHKKLYIYTCDQALIRKLNQHCKDNPKEWKRTNQERDGGKVVSAEFEGASKNLLTIRKKILRKDMTEEQKKQKSELIKKVNTSKKT
jgi:adenosyl cobinamide kinase/adenosyl cobinamide phosphate guanylyltransferase